MAIPPAENLTQLIRWLRGVSRDGQIAVLHRFALLGIGLHNRRDEPDAVASEIGVDHRCVLRAIDIGIQRGWLVEQTGRVQLAFPFPPRNLQDRPPPPAAPSLTPRRAQ